MAMFIMAFNSVLSEDLLLVKLSCSVVSHNFSFNSIRNYDPFTTEECLTLIYHVYMYSRLSLSRS